MARYSRRRGPAVDFPLTDSFQVPTDFAINRLFGQGSLLLLWTGNFFNGTGAPATLGVIFSVDSVPVRGVPSRTTLLDGGVAEISCVSFVPISRGIHLLAPIVVGVAAAGGIIQADSAEFIVIELPEWDVDDDLITL